MGRGPANREMRDVRKAPGPAGLWSGARPAVRMPAFAARARGAQEGNGVGAPGSDDGGVMLERQTLLLRPWAPALRPPAAAGGAEARREVVDPETGAVLGFARRGWGAWAAAPALAVHEAGDEPLLCTVQRFWWFGRVWELREADGHRVATIRRRRITDRWGRPLAVREGRPGGAVAWAARPGASPLATLTPTAEGLRLRFADEVAELPFVKMALLAAALVVEGKAASA